MGKASRWFRALFGLRKEKDKEKQRRRWSFVNSYRENSNRKNSSNNDKNTTQSAASDHVVEQLNRHAMDVADSAVAANAETTTPMVILTNSTKNANAECVVESLKGRDDSAAIKIQSAFKGYLARRALRALRGLVRLQALVRGYIVRKQIAEWLGQMHTLLRAQALAKEVCSQVSKSPSTSHKSLLMNHQGPATPEKSEHILRNKIGIYGQPSMLKRNSLKPHGKVSDNQEKASMRQNWTDRRMNERTFDYQVSDLICDEKVDKILQVHTGKQNPVRKHNTAFRSAKQACATERNCHTFTTRKDSTQCRYVPSSYSCELRPLRSLKFSNEVDESSFCLADYSPQVFSLSSKKSPSTPTKSDCSRSYFSNSSDCPNYMACTEASRAKVRSLSAPKQRPQYERSSSTKRYSLHGESRLGHQKNTSLHTSFTSKAYPGSGYLDRHGMPLRY